MVPATGRGLAKGADETGHDSFSAASPNPTRDQVALTQLANYRSFTNRFLSLTFAL